MFRFFYLLKEALHILRSDDYRVVRPEELRKQRKESARGICARLSLGNVFFKDGKYITTRQFKKEKKRILAR